MKNAKVIAINPGSDNLSEDYRKELSEIFGCPVNQFYGCMECGNFGKQMTGETDYYIDASSFYFEILKFDCDEPVQDGEMGRIVVTDFYNYAFPLIRFDIGDLGTLKKVYTSDGKFKLFLTQLQGRKVELLYDCAGLPIANITFWSFFRLLSNRIKQVQVVQTDICDYTFIINGNPANDDIDFIKAHSLQVLGNNANISIDIVDDIPVLSSGKRRYCEQRCEKYLRAMK